MLHHHGGAGSPYMAPTTTAGTDPFSPTPTGPAPVAAVIPPPPMELQAAAAAAGTTRGGLVELQAGGSSAAAAAGGLQDDDVPADAGAGGGHRWPREETLALIGIRTEMDADFRNAPLKAPLWEDVAR